MDDKCKYISILRARGMTNLVIFCDLTMKSKRFNLNDEFMRHMCWSILKWMQGI